MNITYQPTLLHLPRLWWYSKALSQFFPYYWLGDCLSQNYASQTTLPFSAFVIPIPKKEFAILKPTTLISDLGIFKMFLPHLLRQLKFCLWKPIFESKIYISNIQFSEYSLLQLTWQRTKIDPVLRIIDCYMEKNIDGSILL